jgi:amino acid transporter
LARFDPKRNVPVAATTFISILTTICLLILAIEGGDPYAWAIPVLIGLGTLGIIALQAAAAVAIVFYVFRRRRQAGIVTIVASICAAVGLCMALGTVCSNFTLLSTVDTPLVSWSPAIGAVTFVLGMGYAFWLRRARPDAYSRLALAEHHEAARSRTGGR